MRWRLIDKVVQLEAWESAGGVKAVSFEEYALREPFGREGTLPETMAMESCVELIRWLVAHSSDFELTCFLQEVSGFSFRHEAGMGDTLDLRATVIDRDEATLTAECTIAVQEREIATGTIRVCLVPMAESFDVEWMRGRWCDLYATA